jgi:hypothetical protein
MENIMKWLKCANREGPYALELVRNSSSQSNGLKVVGPIPLFTLDKGKISIF